MALERLTADVAYISKLDNYPSDDMDANSLKYLFDKGSIDIKNFLNSKLIPQIEEQLVSNAENAQLAEEKATEAAGFAEDAEEWAMQAAGYAVNASSSAVDAAQSEAEARNSANAAAGSALSVASSATLAQTHASNAFSYAEAAGNYANTAEAAKAAAESAADIATAKAVEAADSAVSAQIAADRAEQTVAGVDDAVAAVTAKAGEAAQSAASASVSAAQAQGYADSARESADSAASSASIASAKASEADAAKDAIENLSVSATGLPAGSEPAVTKIVEDGIVTLVFSIPEGKKGDQGPKGKNLEFVWDGTRLGVRVEGDDAYQYVDLKGETGPAGRGIASVTKKSGTGAPGTYDTYTITFTDGTTFDFQVYNGANGEGSGDMMQAVYDTDGDGIVKAADVAYSVDWTNVQGRPVIPTALADLEQDSSHRTVTDAEKATWNSKQDALGFTPVPNTRKVNGKALSSDITLDAADIGAVPTTRKINGKSLTADVSLSATDVGAAAASHTHTKSQISDFPASMMPTAHASTHKTGGSDALTPADIGAATSGHTHSDYMPKSGGTFTGIATAQSNTSYTTPQIRNIVLSTSDPSGGNNGEIWIKYQ